MVVRTQSEAMLVVWVTFWICSKLRVKTTHIVDKQLVDHVGRIHHQFRIRKRFLHWPEAALVNVKAFLLVSQVTHLAKLSIASRADKQGFFQVEHFVPQFQDFDLHPLDFDPLLVLFLHLFDEFIVEEDLAVEFGNDGDLEEMTKGSTLSVKFVELVFGLLLQNGKVIVIVVFFGKVIEFLDLNVVSCLEILLLFLIFNNFLFFVRILHEKVFFLLFEFIDLSFRD